MHTESDLHDVERELTERMRCDNAAVEAALESGLSNLRGEVVRDLTALEGAWEDRLGLCQAESLQVRSPPSCPCFLVDKTPPGARRIPPAAGKSPEVSLLRTKRVARLQAMVVNVWWYPSVFER
eukprot:634102-Prorocentrum_minimum.AAC.5